MSDRLKLTLRGLWLIAALSAIVLPVFLPSGPRSQLFGNPIDLAMVSMFLLSLPGSLVAIPMAEFIDAAIGPARMRIGGQYSFILLLFLVGVVQWFYLVPKLMGGSKVVQTIELSDWTTNVSLPETQIAEFDPQGATRLERVLRHN